jgi:hypothetical protein
MHLILPIIGITLENFPQKENFVNVIGRLGLLGQFFLQLLLRDVKLPNTSLHYTPLMFSQHMENSSINISQE